VENANRSTALLSKREWMAATTMAGLVASPRFMGNFKDAAADARKCADMLLLELAR
jgi:hypothetical protein